MSAKILKLLEKFDLNDVEAKLYLALLKNSPQKYLELSRATKTPRSSVYDNIDKLAEKGLITIAEKGSSKTLIARPPDFLGEILEQHQQKLQDLNHSYQTLKTHFQSLATDTAYTKTTNYQGRDGIRSLLDDRLSAKTDIVSFTSLGLSTMVGASYYKDWLKSFNTKKTINRAIINPEKPVMDYLKQNIEVGEYHHDLEDIRYLLKTRFYITGDVSIYNDAIALIYQQNATLIGTKIENPHFAKLQQDLFQQLWFTAKPISDLLK